MAIVSTCLLLILGLNDNVFVNGNPVAAAKAAASNIFFPGATNANDEKDDPYGGDIYGDEPEQDDFLIELYGDDDDEEETNMPTLSLSALIARAGPMPENKVEECSTDWNSLPGVDPETEQWDCIDLLDQGPCAENEWFVLDTELDENGQPRGVCKAKDCTEQDGFVLFNGTCQPIGKVQPCPKGMEILIDPFGQGQCDCIPHYIPYVESDGTDSCYAEYLQGPCKIDEQLIDIKDDEELLKMHDQTSVCQQDFCANVDFIRWSNGDCIPSIDCSKSETIEYDEKERGLKCASIGVRQGGVIELPEVCPPDQKMNHNGECKKVVSLRRSGSNSRPARKLATKNSSLSDFMKKRFE